MKLFYTLVQDLFPDGKDLGDHLKSLGITYQLGADHPSELLQFGYVIPNVTSSHPLLGDHLVAKYVIMIDDYELSALMLSVPGIQIIKNRPLLNYINKIRNMLRWILK